MHLRGSDALADREKQRPTHLELLRVISTDTAPDRYSETWNQATPEESECLLKNQEHNLLIYK